MKAIDIIDIIEKIAPPAFAASWDASGVQVASLRPEVRSVAVMLDPTLDGLEAAVHTGADFILAHHPLGMQPRFPNRCDDYLAILALLFSRGIWLYSAHTSLDANPKGPVRWLADDLGLTSLEILEPAAESGTGLPESGFGFTGLLSEALPYADFCRVLARVLGADAWQACGPKPESLRRVACCPGSGGALVQAAIDAGADVFITGDFKYHAALDAVSAGLRVLDVGHFVLEEEMMRRFSVRLEQDLGLPVRFFPGQDPLRPDGPHWS